VNKTLRFTGSSLALKFDIPIKFQDDLLILSGILDKILFSKFLPGSDPECPEIWFG
jgi:hypothetical protein